MAAHLPAARARSDALETADGVVLVALLIAEGLSCLLLKFVRFGGFEIGRLICEPAPQDELRMMFVCFSPRIEFCSCNILLNHSAQNRNDVIASVSLIFFF